MMLLPFPQTDIVPPKVVQCMLRNPYSSECVEGKFSEVRRTRSLISPLYSPECLESSPGLLFPHDTEVIADLFIRWLLNVHVGSGSVLYSIPDENLPTITTRPGQGDNFPTVTTTGSQPFQELLNAFPTLEDQAVFLEYGPRGKPKQTFQGTIKKEGIEVDGKVSSPSYAAVYCIQKAGSPRKTANGWLMWKTKEGKYLNDLYQHIGDEADESEQTVAGTGKLGMWEEMTP